MREAHRIDHGWNSWSRLIVGLAVALGVVGVTAGIAKTVTMGETNQAAQQTTEALRVIRTNNWLNARSLDPSSSADMMKALILACDEIRTRGERC